MSDPSRQARVTWRRHGDVQINDMAAAWPRTSSCCCCCCGQRREAKPLTPPPSRPLWCLRPVGMSQSGHYDNRYISRLHAKTSYLAAPHDWVYATTPHHFSPICRRQSFTVVEGQDWLEWRHQICFSWAGHAQRHRLPNGVNFSVQQKACRTTVLLGLLHKSNEITDYSLIKWCNYYFNYLVS